MGGLNNLLRSSIDVFDGENSSKDLGVVEFSLSHPDLVKIGMPAAQTFTARR